VQGSFAPLSRFSFPLSRLFSGVAGEAKKNIHVTFITSKGEEIETLGAPGMSLLELAHGSGIPLEGACEGNLACSTCHVYVDDECFDKLPPPETREDDMLDLAFGLQDNSRLGCQIKLTPELDGIRVTLPAATRNLAVDGYVTPPH
jgi:ferredoxin